MSTSVEKADSGKVTPPNTSMRRYIVGGIASIALLVGGLGGWAATSEIAGAVLAQGTVVVDSNVKKVQHPTGGIVGDLFVREGRKVNAGDILLTLDGTATRANLQVIINQLDELAMRMQRLKAERDDAGSVILPAMLASRSESPDVREIVAGELSLFISRRSARTARKAQLGERADQIAEEVKGLDRQIAAKSTELKVVADELIGLEQLAKTNLVQISRVNAMRREAARLEGEIGRLTADIAQANGRIAETKLQILQTDQDVRTETVKELRDAQGREAELSERRIAAEDLLRRIDIRSPQAGTVHQLMVHTVGGVINPGEQLMLIVPEGDKLVIETKVAQQDIEQLHSGQEALLRLTAFNSRTTPEIYGRVDRIAPDLSRDPNTGIAYFVVRVVISDEELARIGDKKLMPGMPVDVQIRTQERTALSYFIKPFTDQVARAFRER